jgi:FdhD protein
MAVIETRLRRIDLKSKTVAEKEDVVASDAAVCLFINGEYFRTLIATPEMLEELVVGHLLTERIITTMEDLVKLEVDAARADVELRGELDLRLLSMGKVNLITTACGSVAPPLRVDSIELPRSDSAMRVEAEDILGMVKGLNDSSTVYRETGGTHSAALCGAGGEVIAFAEDVGRHNAVDKVVGAGVLRRVDLGGCVLISSGRQSGEMVLKAARGGIPIVASVAGPMESGIRLAEAAGITLVCFVRGRHMNVYTNPERISIPEWTDKASWQLSRT